MAAPPSKPSPSNQPVHKTAENVEASALPVKENPTLAKVSVESPIEAYEKSETSDFYKLAKLLLAEGDFESALTSIEKGIEGVKDSQEESAIAPVSLHFIYKTKTVRTNVNRSSHFPTVSLPLWNNSTVYYRRIDRHSNDSGECRRFTC
jgi:hypothetical protein